MKNTTFRITIRLLGTQITFAVLCIFIQTGLATLWDNTIYQWGLTLLFVGAYLAVLWVMGGEAGHKDVQRAKIAHNQQQAGNDMPAAERNAFQPKKGFISGLLSQIPSIILYVLMLIPDTELIGRVAIRFLNIMYMQAYVQWEAYSVYVFAGIICIDALLPGLAYRTGPERQRKIELTIERNKNRKDKTKPKKKVLIK